jgi:hypothetical protein
MADPPSATGRRHPTPSPLTAGKGEGPRAARPGRGQAAANPFRRPDRAAFGFWLGGVFLGAGGCLVGACMPYRLPVAVALSVLRWGLYAGCAGGSLGALVGWLTERTPAPPSRGSEDAGKPPTGARFGFADLGPQGNQPRTLGQVLQVLHLDTDDALKQHMQNARKD